MCSGAQRQKKQAVAGKKKNGNKLQEREVYV